MEITPSSSKESVDLINIDRRKAVEREMEIENSIEVDDFCSELSELGSISELEERKVEKCVQNSSVKSETKEPEFLIPHQTSRR